MGIEGTVVYAVYYRWRNPTEVLTQFVGLFSTKARANNCIEQLKQVFPDDHAEYWFKPIVVQ